MSFGSVFGTCLSVLAIFGTILIIIDGILEFSKFVWEFIINWKTNYKSRKSKKIWKLKNKKRQKYIWN